ncbi:hypothetical protein Pelo_17361 [Pelomyxa schiedti]|nr:hypothetical protein Pelo_17361 [Pelomyxa schiedti]
MGKFTSCAFAVSLRTGEKTCRLFGDCMRMQVDKASNQLVRTGPDAIKFYNVFTGKECHEIPTERFQTLLDRGLILKPVLAHPHRGTSEKLVAVIDEQTGSKIKQFIYFEVSIKSGVVTSKRRKGS